MINLYVTMTGCFTSRSLTRMTRAIESLSLVVSASFGSALLVALPLYLMHTGDPRFLDGSLTSDEMNFVELTLFIIGLVCALFLWVFSTLHCFIHTNRTMAVVLGIFWPLSMIYPWFVVLQTK